MGRRLKTPAAGANLNTIGNPSETLQLANAKIAQQNQNWVAEKGSEFMKKVNAADIIMGQIVEMLEGVFHIEDMYSLARQNSFIALNFMELICNLDYVIFTPTEMAPAGATMSDGLIGAAQNIIGIGGKTFRLTPQGKLAAIAECFRVQAVKLDSMITNDLITTFMQGTGAAQIAQDAVSAFLKGNFAAGGLVK